MSFTKFNYTKDKVQCQENGSCIVTMNKNEILMFSGYVRIHVTKGQIEVNGYIIKANNNTDEANYFNLYSIPYWKHNCLSIKSLTKSQIHLHPFDFTSQYEIEKTSETCDSIFNIIGCHFILDELQSHKYKPLIIPLSWQKSANYFVQSSNINNTIMICGRIHSGKSTYSNYLINKLLNKYNQVAYLDCDIGQCEFNPEGMISITIIKYPLLGPAHTHQYYMKNINDNNKYYKCWKSYYYGSNNASDNPEMYLKCIHKLYTHWIEYLEEQNENIPLVINTLGWVSNLGANILKSLIVSIKPNNLIEIYNKNEPLFGGVEMDYLSEVKDMFIQQNKIHNWCDNNYKLNKNKCIKNNNNSLVSSWWKQLTTTDELAIKEYKQLKPSQKKWFKYLNNLVELQFENENNNYAKWYNNINVSNNESNVKINSEIQLFKTFINARIHYVKSVSKTFENDDSDEKYKNNMKLRKQRAQIAVQKRLLAMISYFTQQLFLNNKPAKYLREIECYKIPFNCISVMFLEENMSVNENKNLILHALDGVIVGLGVMNELNDKLEINEPPLKKMKYNKLNNNNCDMKWDLNVINVNDCKSDIECVGLGIIRSINVKKQLFYLITPVMVSELNKINVFIRGRTRIPSMLIYDESILTPPFYVNSIPINERILKATC